MLTSYLAETSVDVNEDDNISVDSCRRQRHPLSVAKPLEQCETLADRLQWVIEELADDVGNASTWATSVGLDRGAISTTLRRNGGMRPDTVKKLADYAGVSRDWLLYGEGGPDEGPAESSDPYPNRVKAIKEARRGGLVSRSALVAARKLEGPKYERLAVEQWHKALLELTVIQLRKRAV